MRLLAQTALAVLVITGWMLALVWLAASVSQIAVERATTVSEPPCVAAEGVLACLP